MKLLEWWQDCPKYPKYEVSYSQKVRHKVNKKVLSFYWKEGYKFINIGRNKKGNCYKHGIHQVVGWAFIPNPDNKPELHHIDTIKTNNHPSNLMWVTRAEHRALSAQLEQTAHKLKKHEVCYIRDNYSLYNENSLAEKFNVSIKTIKATAFGKSRAEVKYPIKESPYSIAKLIIGIETGIFYDSPDELSTIIGIKAKEIRRMLSGERYCKIPYRYANKDGIKMDVSFLPPPKPKKEKPPKKERPPRKVYVPHPLVLKKIKMFDMQGNEIKEWDSVREAAQFVNSKPDTFRRSIKGSPNNFTKGYIWKYA